MPANNPQAGETWKHKGDGGEAVVVELYNRGGQDGVVYDVPAIGQTFEYTRAHFLFHFAFVSGAAEEAIEEDEEIPDVYYDADVIHHAPDPDVNARWVKGADDE